VLQVIWTPAALDPFTVQTAVQLGSEFRQTHEMADVPQVFVTHDALTAPPALTTQS
jgi:ABC-type sulfate/molybdate transport systems ATPase subunit